MTQLERRCRRAITAWCRAHDIAMTCRAAHVRPRAYVLGRAAPMCLVVAAPWVDSDPLCARFDKENPLMLVSVFDESLRGGDWCTTAYVSRDSCGGNIAIPVVA